MITTKTTTTTTTDRAEISRRNGAKSRGPKTPEGKNRSRFNALKHGRTAKLLAVSREVAEALQIRIDTWTTAHQPRSDMGQTPDALPERKTHLPALARWKQPATRSQREGRPATATSPRGLFGASRAPRRPGADGLTPRRRECLDFMRCYYALTGVPATRSQISKALGLPRQHGVTDFLRPLLEKGFVRMLSTSDSHHWYVPIPPGAPGSDAGAPVTPAVPPQWEIVVRTGRDPAVLRNEAELLLRRADDLERLADQT